MAKIYTKTGDKGYTSLTGGKRVKKSDVRVEAYGTVDEANSMLGLAIAKIKDDSLTLLREMLIEIQNNLFHVGAELSTPEGEEVYWPLKEENIKKLESYIDQLDSELPELKQFIIPGGSEAGAILHLSRSLIRRAERISVEASKDKVSAYLNRCSDFLFVAARWINMKNGEKEFIFQP